MVLARALASSRATISHRSVLTSTRLASPARARHCLIAASKLVLSRRHYAVSPDEGRRRLIDALYTMSQPPPFSEGTPEQQSEAKAKFFEAKDIVRSATPLQRRNAMAELQAELSSLEVDPSPPSTSVPASVGADGGGSAQAAGQPVASPAPDKTHAHVTPQPVHAVGAEGGADVGDAQAESQTVASPAADEPDADPTRHTVKPDDVQAEGQPDASLTPEYISVDVTRQTVEPSESLPAAAAMGVDLTGQAVVPDESTNGPVAEESDAHHHEGPIAEQVRPMTSEEREKVKSFTPTMEAVVETNVSPFDRASHSSETIGSLTASPSANEKAADDTAYSIDGWITQAANVSAPDLNSGSPETTSTTRNRNLIRRTSFSDKPGDLPRPLVRKYIAADIMASASMPDNGLASNSVVDPNDPRKWDLLHRGQRGYPDLPKDEEARLLILRRRRLQGMVRRVDKLWLRNACTCTACVDPATGWKNFNITSVPEDLPTSKVEFNATSGDLEIEWENDFLTGMHKSVYPNDVLEYFNRPHKQARVRHDGQMIAQNRMLWHAKKLTEHPLRVDSYSAWQAGGVSSATALESLHIQGAILIKGTENIPVEEVASVVGPPRNTIQGLSWDVGRDPHPRVPNAPSDGAAMSPETYAPWLLQTPRLVFLQCLENTVDGGENILVDGIKTVYDMQEFEATKSVALDNYPFRFASSDTVGANSTMPYRNRHSCVHLLTRDGRILRLHQKAMSSDPLYNNFGSVRYSAACIAVKAWVARIEDPVNQVVHKMEKGDCLIYDNWRILLGRAAFSPTSGTRRFRSAMINNDEWQSCVNKYDTPGHRNYGDLPVGVSYENQVWQLAGLDPATRPSGAPKGRETTKTTRPLPPTPFAAMFYGSKAKAQIRGTQQLAS